MKEPNKHTHHNTHADADAEHAQAQRQTTKKTHHGHTHTITHLASLVNRPGQPQRDKQKEGMHAAYGTARCGAPKQTDVLAAQ